MENSQLLIIHLMILLAIFVMKPLILIIAQLLLIAQNVSIKMGELSLTETELTQVFPKLILILSMFMILEPIEVISTRMNLFEEPV